MRRFVIVACLFLGSPVAVAAEVFAIDGLEGRWVSQDPAYGVTARSSLMIEQIYDGAMHRFTYDVQRADGDAPARVFGGVAHYRRAQGEILRGQWVDSNGALMDISAQMQAQTLTSTWQNAAGKGQTRYTRIDENTLRVEDYRYADDSWQVFNAMTFQRAPEDEGTQRLVTGIGGLFFRSDKPAALAGWYEQHFAIDRVPTSYDALPWRQEAGFTVFSPFPRASDYFGDAAQAWMVNLRVRDLDTLVRRLRTAGLTVSEPQTYPNGRFARLEDPEGNPIELWEPAAE